MRAPEVLLLDDGELDDIATLLEELQTPFERLRGGELRGHIPTPGRLLIATPRRVGALRESAKVQRTPLRMVVSEGDSEGLRAQLRRIGFDYLVRRPVHPEALRLLLLRCLYSGEEHREDSRVAVGSPVSFRSGLMPRNATLIDLSTGGCRLLVETRIPVGRRLRVQLPGNEPRDAACALAGRVVRVDEDGGSGSPCSWRVGIAFEALSDPARAELERRVAHYNDGPARLRVPPAQDDDTRVHGAADLAPDAHERQEPPGGGDHRPLLEVKLNLDPEPADGLKPGEGEPKPRNADQRESARVSFAQRIPAFGRSALRVLMGRDLSKRGMRLEPHSGLELGDRIHLAIYGDPEEPPTLIWATIRRDDGDSGLVALFDPLAADIAETLERWVARLPLIESLQDGESQSLGAVLSEILTG